MQQPIAISYLTKKIDICSLAIPLRVYKPIVYQILLCKLYLLMFLEHIKLSNIWKKYLYFEMNNVSHRLNICC